MSVLTASVVIRDTEGNSATASATCAIEDAPAPTVGRALLIALLSGGAS